MAYNINPHSYDRSQYTRKKHTGASSNVPTNSSNQYHQNRSNHSNHTLNYKQDEYNRNAYYHQANNQAKQRNTRNHYKPVMPTAIDMNQTNFMNQISNAAQTQAPTTAYNAEHPKAHARTTYDRSVYTTQQQPTTASNAVDYHKAYDRSAYTTQQQQQPQLEHQEALPDFNEWIAGLNLSSPQILEKKVDEICEGIADRLNPANEAEYMKVMQSHLLLEVWSQIRTFIAERLMKNDFFSNTRIKHLNCTKSSNNRNRRYERINITQQFEQMNIRQQTQALWSGSIAIRCRQKNVSSIPYQCYLLLLWRNKTKPLNLDDDTECSTFPPHVIVQVDQLRTQRKGYVTEHDVALRMNGNSYRLMAEYKQLYSADDNYDLQVIPIQNLIYLERDYDAVRNIDAMPLCSYIMGRGSLMQHKMQSTENLFAYISANALVEEYAQCLNESQAVALQEALAKPLTLIHGPPGTGKTKYALLPILKAAYVALKIKYDAMNRKAMSRLNYDTTNLLNQMRDRWKEPRIGVFAGSNQAIDEVILTMLSNDSRYQSIPIARMGNTLNMDPNVAKQKTVNINLWIDYYLRFKWNQQSKKECNNAAMRIKQRLNQIDEELAQIEAQIRCGAGGGQAILVDDALWQYICKCMTKSNALHLERSCLIKVDNIKYWNQAQRVLLPAMMRECEVLFCTANYVGRCGSDALLFDFSLFDESCQMRETEVLIALQYCARAVLIGDPKQLQSTVLYHGKYRHLLLNSLFTRVEKYMSPIMLLEQYRMNAEIALFPSRYFYQNKLLNGFNVQNGEKNKAFHNDKSGDFKPYLFFDVCGVEQRRSNSLLNMAEINKIADLLNAFCTNETYLKEIRSIGIITPYSAHKEAIEVHLLQSLRQAWLDEHSIQIECATVDEFQGSERDIIIFSCVRCNETRNIGFLSDEARLNVAITRAKYALWIVGNTRCLQSDPTWNALLKDAARRNLLKTEYHANNL
eukprot:863884_1